MASRLGTSRPRSAMSAMPASIRALRVSAFCSSRPSTSAGATGFAGTLLPVGRGELRLGGIRLTYALVCERSNPTYDPVCEGEIMQTSVVAASPASSSRSPTELDDLLLLGTSELDLLYRNASVPKL